MDRRKKNLALPDILSRTINEEQFTKLGISQLKYQKTLNFTLQKHRLEIISNANIASVITTMWKKQIKHTTLY